MSNSNYDEVFARMFENLGQQYAGRNPWTAAGDYAYFQQRAAANGFTSAPSWREQEAERIGRVQRICKDASKKGWRVKIEYDGRIGGCYRATFFYPKEGKVITPTWPAYNKALALEDAALELYEWSMREREKQSKRSESEI
jgi:hypothetical protein